MGLHMDRDSETGDWQCPVMTKAFSSSSGNNNNNTTKIVAILTPSKKEAYVYSYEAYFELNVKPKNYIDLTTGHKFSPKTDVLILNDPQNDNFQRVVRDVSTFWHIKNARSKKNTTEGNGNGNSGNVRKSVTATRVMEQLYKDRIQREEKDRINAKEEAAKKKKDDAENKKKNTDNNYTFDTPFENLSFPIPAEDVTGVKYATGSGGFTSTAANDNNSSSTNPTATAAAIGIRSSDGGRQLLREATKEEILQSQFKVMKSKSMKGRKGYVRLFVEIRNNNDHYYYYDNKKNKKKTTTTTSKEEVVKAVIVPLLLELHCDIVPKTCANFLGLCRRKRYDGTIFHRLIPDFMIQGGGEKMKQQQHSLSSTTTTTTTTTNTPNNNNNHNHNSNGNSTNSDNNPDASLWGPPFEDEFDQRLKHDGEGVVCMANAGPNTNKQQFYITLSNNKTKSQHLDRKHSVFGKVVKEGMKELTTALQKVKADSKDRPVIKTFDINNSGEKTKTHIVVVIVATEVLEDPAWEAQQTVEQRLTKLHEEREAKTKKRNEQQQLLLPLT